MIDLDRLVGVQRRLMNAATATAPPDWDSFKVVVKVHGDSFQLSIEGPSLLAPADDIYEPAREVLDIHSEGGHPLKGFSYEFTRIDDSWKGVGAFDYVG